MALVRRTEINIDVQKKILIGLIVNTKFCREILPLLNREYFTVSYIQRIVEWIEQYFMKYEEAPNHHIQDIFEVEKEKMDEDEMELVEDFLSSLSKEYEREQFNVDYFLDEALKFFKKRSLELTAKRVNTSLQLGKIGEAEDEMRNYKQVAKITSQWINPFEKDYMTDVIEKQEEEFFLFPGKLGELIGNLERGYLVGVMGPYKRGKTFWLLEFAVEGMLKGLKVVFISFEMSDSKVSRRIYKRLGSFADQGGEITFPCFDCKKNQTGECRKRERESPVPLFKDGERPKFKKGMEYQPCTYCRERNLSDYSPTTWFVMETRPRLTVRNMMKKMKGIRRMMGDALRIKAYPAYAANLMDIKRDLENLEWTEGFIPDMIITDYAGILAPEDKRIFGRDQIDLVWKAHKNLAATKHCLVVTGSQSNRDSAKKTNVESTDASDDIRKLAHVDGMMMLSQTSEEKERKIMRISYVNRHGEYNENKKVQVLQNFNVGQALIDSETFHREKKK